MRDFESEPQFWCLHVLHEDESIFTLIDHPIDMKNHMYQIIIHQAYLRFDANHDHTALRLQETSHALLLSIFLFALQSYKVSLPTQNMKRRKDTGKQLRLWVKRSTK